MNSFPNKNEHSSKQKSLYEPQVQYLGRWVNPLLFRAFVYNKEGEEILAKSWEEFKKLTSEGEWFETKESAQQSLSEETPVKKERGRPRNDTLRAVS